jgi:hypothetical protein
MVFVQKLDSEGVKDSEVYVFLGCIGSIIPYYASYFSLTFQLKQAGKGGELTHDETTIIAGALELTEKKAKDAMTPICQMFAIDINANLDR